jgi:hypothetical protein
MYLKLVHVSQEIQNLLILRNFADVLDSFDIDTMLHNSLTTSSKGGYSNSNNKLREQNVYHDK